MACRSLTLNRKHSGHATSPRSVSSLTASLMSVKDVFWIVDFLCLEGSEITTENHQPGMT